MWSRFFIAPVLLISASVSAAELVNINTATLAELDTLPGVGPATAQSIIDNRPYAAINEISRAAGIGEPGSTSYENIKDFITVSSAPQETQTQQTTQTETQIQDTTQITQVSGGSAPPPALAAHMAVPSVQIVGAGAYFSGSAYNAAGDALGAGVRYMWNFGDGATAEGKRVFHVYTYPGRYAARLDVAYGYSSAGAQHIVEVAESALTLSAENDGSLLLWNSSAEDVDVGLWMFVHDEHTFVVPEHTLVLSGEGLRFAPAVTGIIGAANISKLLYPNGAEALVAGYAADSPLRGERVLLPQDSASDQAYLGAPLITLPDGSMLDPDAPALPRESVAAAAGGVLPQLGVWAGLISVLGVGMAGAYYAQRNGKSETPRTPEEFELSDD